MKKAFAEIYTPHTSVFKLSHHHHHVLAPFRLCFENLHPVIQRLSICMLVTDKMAAMKWAFMGAIEQETYIMLCTFAYSAL